MIAVGVGKPKSPSDYGSTMSGDDDSPDAEAAGNDDESMEGHEQGGDYNSDGEPEFKPPAGYTPPDDAKPGEEIPVLAKVRMKPDGMMCIVSIDGAPFKSGDEENTETDQSEMKLDDQTPTDDNEPPAQSEDMNNAPGAMSDRLQRLRMKLKAKM